MELLKIIDENFVHSFYFWLSRWVDCISWHFQLSEISICVVRVRVFLTIFGYFWGSGFSSKHFNKHITYQNASTNIRQILVVNIKISNYINLKKTAIKRILMKNRHTTLNKISFSLELTVIKCFLYREQQSPQFSKSCDPQLSYYISKQ